MNKVYKVVYNQGLKIFQVVSELAKGHAKAAASKAERRRNKGQDHLIAGGVLCALTALTALSFNVSAADTITNGKSVSTEISEDGATGTINTTDEAILAAVTAGAGDNQAILDSGVSRLLATNQNEVSVPNGVGALDTGWEAQANGITVKKVTSEDAVLNFKGDGSRIAVSNDNGAVKISMSATPEFSSMAIAYSDVKLLKTGLNNGMQKLSGVVAGTSPTDAVNKQQLDDAVKYVQINSNETTNKEAVKASATGIDAIALGGGSKAAGDQATAVGWKASAAGASSAALGNGASTTEESAGSIALGQNAQVTKVGEGAIAIGQNTTAGDAHSIAFGQDAEANGGAMAFGKAAVSVGAGAIAFGTNSNAGGNALAFGFDSSAASGAAAFGASAQAGGAGSLAMGTSAHTSGTNDISLGNGAGEGSVSSSTALDQENRIAIGTGAGANVSGNEDIAIGLQSGSGVSGKYNIAIGSSAGGGIKGDENTSIGFEANKTGSGSHSTAIGASTSAVSGGTALGYTASAEGENSIAIGFNAQALGSAGIAIGTNAVANGKGIALGDGSQANDEDSKGNSYLTGVNPGTSGVVSVGLGSGDNAFQRRITNVADGASGYDAVNVNQLKAAQTSVADLVGGDVVLQANGKFSPIKVTDAAGTEHNFSTISEALSQLSNGTISIAPGDAIKYADNAKTTVNLGGPSYDNETGEGGTAINNVAKATQGDQAVNLDLLNNTIQKEKAKYFSVNSTETGNRDNTGASLGEDAMAVGPVATATGQRSISFGFNTKAQGINSIVIGNAADTKEERQAVAYDESGIAIGTSASTHGTNSITLGTYASTNVQTIGGSVNNAIAVGYAAQGTADQAVAIGQNAHAAGSDSFAQGTNASAIGMSSTAVGYMASASGAASLAIGMNASTAAAHSGLIGTTMSTDKADDPQASRLFGSDTYTLGNGNQTIYGKNSSFMGNGNTIGYGAADGGDSGALYVEGSRVLGNENKVLTKQSNIIGSKNMAGIFDRTTNTPYAENIGILGNDNRVTALKREDRNNIFIMGNNVNATISDSVYLGSKSAAVKGDTTQGVDGYSEATIGSKTYAFAGGDNGKISGVVTVGSTIMTRRIQNVSPGLLSAASTDAVNGSQLYALTQPLRFGGDNSTFGDTPDKDVNVIQRGSDQALKVTGGSSVSAEKLTDNNIGVLANTADNSLTVKLGKDLNLTAAGSVTIGNAVINNDGVKIGGVSLKSTGLNNGDNRIINVAAGTADTDAVNVSQLNKAVSGAAKPTAVTVNGGKTAPEDKTYTDGNLQLKKIVDDNGKDTYDVKLNDKVTLGTDKDKQIVLDGITGKIDVGEGETLVSLDGVVGKGSFGGAVVGRQTVENAKKGTETGKYVTGLDNKTWAADNITSGRAATEDQLKKVSDAIGSGSLSFGGDTGTAITKNLGETLDIKGGTNDTTKLTDNNIGVVSENGQLNIKLNKDLDLGTNGSVTMGNTVINTDGVKISKDNVVSVSLTNTGLNNGGNKITNVAAGTENTDAVNLGQLKDLVISTAKPISVTVNGGTSAPEGGLYNTEGNLQLKKTDNDGQLEYDVKLNDKVTLGEKEKQIVIDGIEGFVTVGSQVKLGTQTFENKGTNETGYFLTGLGNTTFTISNGGYKNYEGSNRAATEGQLYDAFDFLDKKIDGITIEGDKNIDVNKKPDTSGGTGDIEPGQTPKPSPGWDVSMSDTPTFGGGETGTDKTKPGSVTVVGSQGHITINEGDKGTVSGLSNLKWDSAKADVDVKDGGYKNSSNAATESQLQQAVEGTVQYDRDKDGNINKGSITLAGGNGGTTITNVADGKVSADSKDAVNGSQLHGVQEQVTNNTTAITNIGNGIHKLDRRINKVGAGAAALAALHPLDFDPDDKWDFSAGYGNYANADAVAVGAYYRPNEDTMFSVGGAFGNGENMVNAGVSFKLGQGNHVSTSRVAMAKELKSLRAGMAQQAAQIQQLVAIVNALTGMQAVKPDTTAMFPDVPENHWAYEAVRGLMERGFFKGYPDGAFGGDKNMTRYEFAEAIYSALKNGAEVDGRLVNEFKSELEWIRIDTISKDKEGNPVIERVRVNQQSN